MDRFQNVHFSFSIDADCNARNARNDSTKMPVLLVLTITPFSIGQLVLALWSLLPRHADLLLNMAYQYSPWNWRPFTVFAPTDEAFAKLPAGTVEGLLKDIPQLKKVLTYHVVSGKVMAADVSKMKSATTNSMVTKADIAADNGVIHVIDSVLMPA